MCCFSGVEEVRLPRSALPAYTPGNTHDGFCLGVLHGLTAKGMGGVEILCVTCLALGLRLRVLSTVVPLLPLAGVDVSGEWVTLVGGVAVRCLWSHLGFAAVPVLFKLGWLLENS